MEIKCPCCKAKLTLEHIVLNQVRSDLFGLIFSQAKPMQTAIVSYLGLFRGGARDLADDKALRIVQEVLSLPYLSQDTLAAALTETAEAIQAKGQLEPLKNHNYLKSVMRSVEARSVQTAQQIANPAFQKTLPQSKTMAAISGLDGLREKYK